MKKKIIIKRISIVLTLIFSFLFSFLFDFTSISALETEVIQDTVELINTQRTENTITFTTKLVYDVDSITYQITYYANDTDKYSDLVTDSKVKKINDYTYSFEVNSEIVGVKIWKVKYFVSDNYFKNKQTIGNNTIGDIESVYKKNYVEVTTDKLESNESANCDISYGFASKVCEKYYVFYFNLDTEIDWIENLSLEYSIKKVKKTWWGLGGSSSIESKEIVLDHETKVNDYVAWWNYINNYFSDKPFDLFEYDRIRKEAIVLTQREVLGVNTNENGYDWYVQPLLSEVLSDERYNYWFGYEKEYLQEVAIVKMSYYSHGEYFEDIPVLDEDTGWIKITNDENVFDIIKNFFRDNLSIIKWVVIGIVVVLLLPFISFILKFIWFILKILATPFILLKKLMDKSGEKRKKEKEFNKNMKKYEDRKQYNLIKNKRNTT